MDPDAPGSTRGHAGADHRGPRSATGADTHLAGRRRARCRGPLRPVAALAPGTPQHTSRCCGNPAELWLDKTAQPAEGQPLAPGDTVVWTVTVVSTGTAALTPAEVLDVVPDHVTVTDSGGATLSDDGRLLTWRLGLAPGERRELRWTGQLVATSPRGIDVVNTALVPRSGLVDSTSHPVPAVTATPSSATPSSATPTSTTTPAGPTPTPTPTASSPGPTGTPATPAAGPGPTPTRGSAAGAGTSGGPPLSFTGAEVGALAGFALAANSLGVMLVWLVRRSRGRDTGVS